MSQPTRPAHLPPPVRRVLEPVKAPPPVRRADAHRWLWLRGLLAGLQAALLTWVVVVVPAIAAFTATSTASINSNLTWVNALRKGTEFYLSAYGSNLTLVAQGQLLSISVTPLGITLFGLLAARLMGRLAQVGSGWVIGCGALGYLLTVELLALTLGQGQIAWLRIGVGSLLIGVLGMAWGNHEHPPLSKQLRQLAQSMPKPAELILHASGAAGLCLLAVAGGLATIWAVSRQGLFLSAFESLAPDVVGSLALIGLGLAYTPNLIIWSASTMVGEGLGSWHQATAEIPGLPTLTLIPPDTALSWLAVLPVLLGGLSGWWLCRRWLQQNHWWDLALLALATTGLLALAWAGLLNLSSGKVGQFAMVGVRSPARSVGLLFVEMVIPAVLVAVLGRHRVADRLWVLAHQDRPIIVKGRR